MSMSLLRHRHCIRQTESKATENTFKLVDDKVVDENGNEKIKIKYIESRAKALKKSNYI